MKSKHVLEVCIVTDWCYYRLTQYDFLLILNIDCTSLSAPALGLLSTTDVTSGTTVTISCNSGYQLSGGDASRTCTDGLWSGAMPICTAGKSMFWMSIGCCRFIIFCMSYINLTRFDESHLNCCFTFFCLQCRFMSNVISAYVWVSGNNWWR